MKADIFISYAREDEGRVRPIVEALEAQGWTVFWDRTLPVGQTWRSHIGSALDTARSVIVVWSKHSVESEWVPEEAEEAKKRNVYVPVIIDDVMPPLGFRNIQAADLRNWNQNSSSQQFVQLLQSLRSLIPDGENALHEPDAGGSRSSTSFYGRNLLIVAGTLVVALALVAVLIFQNKQDKSQQASSAGLTNEKIQAMGLPVSGSDKEQDSLQKDTTIRHETPKVSEEDSEQADQPGVVISQNSDSGPAQEVRSEKHIPLSLKADELVDFDGNIYKTVKIGDQIWMAENLGVSRYRNGDPIPEVQDPEEWKSLKTGAWCYYKNDEEYGEIYGKLYNWHAVNDPRGLAPEGWHVPSDKEWMKLERYLGMSKEEAEKGSGYTRGGDIVQMLRDTSTVHWNKRYKQGTNSSGFSALGSGYRNDNGRFSGQYSRAYFYTSTSTPRRRGGTGTRYQAYRKIDSKYVNRSADFRTNHGYSVRCVRD